MSFQTLLGFLSAIQQGHHEKVANISLWGLRLLFLGEQDGIDYHFTEKSTMETEIAAGAFIEYAHVHDNIYGTRFITF